MTPNLSGTPFWKMSGSGNDFTFLDARRDRLLLLRTPAVIARLCDRRGGVGADGVVFLEAAEPPVDFRMAYFNADGSRAAMCGNAALCSTRLAVELGAAAAAGMCFASDAGPVAARIVGGLPEVDLEPPRRIAADAGIEAAPGEERIGFATVGVPHLVVLCADVAEAPLETRGARLRRHAALGAPGANVNFVSPGPEGRWRMRTFERGVEGETQACGTGAVACAAVLHAWQLAGAAGAEILTRSGETLAVRFASGAEGAAVAALRGEGRIVFRGVLGEL